MRMDAAWLDDRMRDILADAAALALILTVLVAAMML